MKYWGELGPDMGAGLNIIEFHDLTADQRTKLLSLTLTSRQEVFGGSFAESIADCERHLQRSVRGWCFVFSRDLIGMVVFKRPPASPDWVGPADMSIHGLKIDVPWQGRGLGKAAFELAVTTAAQTWPHVQRLVLAVDSDNVAALAVYRGYGMSECGPVLAGRTGPEVRMHKNLRRVIPTC